MPAKPSFDALPLRKDGPHGNAWGLFGEDDQLGMLNLLTPETTINAAREIIDGTRVSTDLPIGRVSKPFWGRPALHHTIKKWEPVTINDDVVTFNTQSSTQWDGFRHFAYQKEKLFFGGKTQEDFYTSKVNGTHNWVEGGGIVGRGVLLDWASWADAKGIKFDPFTSVSISVKDLKEVAASQGTTFKDGDILFIRSGWLRAVNKLTDDEWSALADQPDPLASASSNQRRRSGGFGITTLPPPLEIKSAWKRGRAKTWTTISMNGSLLDGACRLASCLIRKD
ncbi:hypothetical protein PT974_03878 [Cladobotryum mycophilum]|uniref:Cyclase n=1 Tax=Cladobotryum mycophilum TaxID=491253 RepID=A0ABR0STI5_9HYPO